MNKLFLGIKSHVVCIDKRDGKELWRTKLKSSTITNVYYEDDQVFAYSGGHLVCLNIRDGSVVWTNPLKGLGYSTCIMASEQQSASVIANQIASQQAAAAASASSVGVTAASN
ncbi:PQQ-binding-like beta-propeller repeat protein [uncultured Umboniibacter sp.]|uniref:outer membrane protein assembly factor BamB family protein n=1 Tax=uncultured Umboniibacter sp. TaxID=1798917 RepID=UPI00261D96A7|nr:PQQ-binding-like beta-propeller repeat protein [uncultured Umboniibacter sp.]